MVVTPFSRTFRIDRTRQASPQIFDRLRELIIQLELPPGAVLTRADLMQQFGVSHTPIRDALHRLAEEGLVDIFPQHATVVSSINLEAARQAHFMRKSLEFQVVRKLAEMTDRGFVAELRRTLERQASMLEAENLEWFTAADQLFHRQLFEFADVAELWAVVRSRSGDIDRLRRLHLPAPGKAAGILNDHREITDAIEAGDPPAAEAAMRQHLSGTLSELRLICERHPQYVKVNE